MIRSKSGDTIVSLVCQACGVTYERRVGLRNSKFCSRDCGYAKRTRNPRPEPSARKSSTRRVASKTIELRSKYVTEVADYPNVQRPRTRGDCSSVPRPCPFVSCKWNLYLDVSRFCGNIKLNFPDIEPDEVAPGCSCALDVADGGGRGSDLRRKTAECHPAADSADRR